MHSLTLSAALRALLAAALTAAPTHFASLIDSRHAPVQHDGYAIYVANAPTRALCTQCKVDVEHILTGSSHEWLVRIDLPGGQGLTTPNFDALKAMLAPTVASGFRVSGHDVECDGATQGITWSGAHASIEAIASSDPDSGPNAVSLEVLVTAR